LPDGQLCGAAVCVGAPVEDIDHPIFDESIAGDRAWLRANSTTAHIRVNDVGTFTARDGREVVADLDQGADPEDVDTWLYGHVAVLVLGQQGQTALHATAVEMTDGGAVAVAGWPGAGKTTTALDLCRRGHRLVADDIALLEASRGSVQVRPFGRPVHVWPETAEAIGVSLPTEAGRLGGSGKLSLPPPPSAAAHLKAIAVVDVGSTAVSADPVAPTAAVMLLSAHTCAGSIVRRIWPKQVFAWAAAVASTVPVWRVTRPAHAWTAVQTATAIESLVRCSDGMAS
jgi:hypothetical protein